MLGGWLLMVGKMFVGWELEELLFIVYSRST
jgi:hypothetical protein